MPMVVVREQVEKVTVTTSDGRLYVDAVEEALAHEVNLILGELVTEALGYEVVDLSSRKVAVMLAKHPSYVKRLSNMIRQVRRNLGMTLA